VTAASVPGGRENRVSLPATDGLRVLIADGHRTFAEVLAASLSVEDRLAAVDVAYTPERAKFLLSVRHYDILVLDPSLDLGSWIELLHVAMSERPALVAMVVSELRDIHLAVDALAHGVRAWLPKDVSFAGFLHAIDEVVMGRATLPAALLQAVVKELLDRPVRSSAAPSFLDDLTPRQREVLQCLADGMSRAEIAEQLALSPNTVRTHVQEVLHKAGVHSTLAAVARAREVLGDRRALDSGWD
jgi:DNA-binding NarL/FixJ family response regulator